LVVENNPLTIAVEQMRRVFLFGQNPEWDSLLVLFLVGAIVLQFGYFFFDRTKNGFADVL